MLINRLAAQYLPESVPQFLRDASAQTTMEYLGPEPDRWRGRGEPELSVSSAPEHFIDMEWADLVRLPCAATVRGCESGLMYPRLRYDYLRAIAAAAAVHPELHLAPEHIGLQPWAVEEAWQRLKSDMREYRRLAAEHTATGPAELAVLYDAGILGHYVADGSQPLHTTIQYNGWTGPNPNGYTTEHTIHAQFESVYVTADIHTADVAALVAAAKPVAIDDEWSNYLAYLRHSNSLVEATYALEKAGGFSGAGSAQARVFTDERLAAGAIELRDLIAAAWVRSGDPVEEYHGPK